MRPILVRAFGRTGTTLLMQLLMTSKDVLVPNGYPYESRYLSYFCRMVKLISNGSNEYTDADVMFKDNILIGSCPYEIEQIVDIDNLKKRLLFGLWNQFSHSIEDSEGKTYRYYAEKVSLDLAPFINENLNAVNNIFLIRDPRGELASIMAFNKKRGFNGFGWQDADTEFGFAKRMIESRKFYFNQLSKYDDSNKNILVIKYEDLASNLEKISLVLGGFLATDFSYQDVIKRQGEFSHHMTSKTPLDSVFRWKKDLQAETIELFENEMKRELEFFEYL